MFKEKSYYMLPKIQIEKWDKSELASFDVDYLRKRKIYPESMLNYSLKLGWGYDLEEEYHTIKNRNSLKVLENIPDLLDNVSFFFFTLLF